MGGIIVVQGYLASGKSTFAQSLAKELRIPYFIKDTFKSALCKNVSIVNREESSRFSAVTFNGMMYAAERLMETGNSLIIEGNFVSNSIYKAIKKTDESAVIKSLADKYNYPSLTFKFHGDTKILYGRFTQREKTSERGDANRLFSEPAYDEFDAWCRNLDDFNVGGRNIMVDTTDFNAVDFPKLIYEARSFLNNFTKKRADDL